MDIAIIGTGNVGSALAKGWAQANHRIFLGVRNIDDFKGKELLSFSDHIQALPIAEAVQKASVILIAATAEAVPEIARAMRDVSQKILIDAMNSVRTKPAGFDNTTAALLALTNSNQIVKCFNTTGAENMFDPIYEGRGLDLFMSGDSASAKQIARELALDLGFSHCYDFGGNDKFDLQEQFALAWINLAMMQGLGRNIGFRLLRR